MQTQTVQYTHPTPTALARRFVRTSTVALILMTSVAWVGAQSRDSKPTSPPAAPSATIGASKSSTRNPTRSKRPNIVVIVLDDAGFSDLGSYGSEIATPNLDSLAKSGVRLTNFHTAATCEPTRAMLHSGVDNHRSGAGTLQVLIADNQKGKPGYEGYLNERSHSMGTLLRDAGYATYFAGKWNLGNGLEHSPGAKGWDRYLALEQTGADHYEARAYAPFTPDTVWWEDGQRATLPKDFYSTRTYVDKLLGYIDQGRPSNKPFLAMLAFQAPHTPLQAPEALIDKYSPMYERGWTQIRQARYERQVAQGLVPAGLELPRLPANFGIPHIDRSDWSKLSEHERKIWARKMASFAAMIDDADRHIGRLREHLKATGELDNTAFIVMSDNGGDGYDWSQANPLFKLWYALNARMGDASIGGPRSFTHYGPHWAEVSNTPFSLIKAFAGEGGMRVPLIISYPGLTRHNVVGDSFAHVTDILPTVLDLAGVPVPGDEYRGQRLYRPTGFSLLPYLQGQSASVRAKGFTVGFEASGAQALFQDQYKLRRQGAPLDGQWRLFDLQADPTESRDISASHPELVRQMMAALEAYNRDNGVILPEADYDPRKQLVKNNLGVMLQQVGGPVLLMLLAVVLLLWGLRRAWLRWSARRLPM